MVIAYHAIFTTYGTWLPNDPRGSYSKEVYNRELHLLGEICPGRQYPQPPKGELRRFWTASRTRLKRPPFFIHNSIRSVVARGFGNVVRRLNLLVHACSIMNDHVHLLVKRSTYRIEYLVGQFKGAATGAMGLMETPWTKRCWKIFLDNEFAICAAAKYIEHNPVAAGIPQQHWSFVTPIT